MAPLALTVVQVQSWPGRAHEKWPVGAGFPAHEQLDTVAEKTEVCAPVRKPGRPKDKAATDPQAASRRR